MKLIKRTAALVCVFVICFSCVASPAANAVGFLGGQAGGALFAAGLVALNIVAHTGAQAIGSYFGWQSAPTCESVLNYAFPVSSQIISDYMNASVIKVDQGIVTIDGVEYDELLISPGALTNGLKTNLFDFKTKWEILSGNAGKLATGEGYFDGKPVYKIGTSLVTQIYQIPFTAGTYQITSKDTSVISNISGWYADHYWYHEGTRWGGNYGNKEPYFPVKCQIRFEGNQYYLYISYPETTRIDTSPRWATFDYVDQPFEYNYVSGIVPATPEDIPSDYGLSIQIPHDKLQTFYNNYPEYNLDNATIDIASDDVDINDLVQSIFDQITAMEEVRAEWKHTDDPVPPGPASDILEGVNTIIEQQNEQVFQNKQQQSIERQQLQQQQQIQQMQQEMQQTQQEIQQTQQQMQESAESVDDTLKDIKTNLEPPEILQKKFDLREIFPFCIPFDIYHLLQKFDAIPSAPHVQLPLVIPSIGFSYTLDLDFSPWDSVAATMRTIELIVYALGLAWATSKVIKW